MRERGLILSVVACAAIVAGCGSASHGKERTAQTTTTTSLSSSTYSPNPVALQSALAAYASCMTAHGVNIPPPHRGARTGLPELAPPTNVSTSSPTFISALRSCRTQAQRALALRYGP